MLDPQPINLKRRGKKNVTHKPTIEEQHFQQLKASGVLFYFLFTFSLTLVCGFILRIQVPFGFYGFLSAVQSTVMNDQWFQSGNKSSQNAREVAPFF